MFDFSATSGTAVRSAREEPVAGSSSDGLVSVVRDGLTPLLLLRRDGERMVVEAVTTRLSIELGPGDDVDDVLVRAGLSGLAHGVVDAAFAAAERHDVVGLDLSGRDASDAFGAPALRFLPIGTDASGSVDLLMVLGEADSAVRDALTGLPGRELLADRWALAVARARRRRGGLSILFIDLDGFKAVNDSHGHGVGDAVLVEVARRIEDVVRDADTVARFGGDEFVVLVDAGRKVGREVAERIVAAVARPIVVDRTTVSIGASVGLAVVDLAGPGRTSLDDAIDAADREMYEAKSSGGGRLRCAV